MNTVKFKLLQSIVLLLCMPLFILNTKSVVATTTTDFLEKAPAKVVWIGDFSQRMDGWREVTLKADTPHNTFAVRQWDGVAALEVHSKGSMSLLAKPLLVDLRATPVLCWRWRIDAPLQNADITARAGDDYAARLYVSFQIPAEEKSWGLRTKLSLARSIWGEDVPDAAMNYVWDNKQPIGKTLPNAYTDRTMMVVLRSGAGNAGQWVEQRRNILQDVGQFFSLKAQAIQLAVTADTDNTGEQAHTGFADIHFVGIDTQCQFTH